ncbi:FG-GAP repeat domain-containing protein, partial [Pedobacter sp.]
MLRILFTYGIVFLFLPSLQAQLVSGKPIQSGNQEGPLSLPFYNGYATGLEDINGDGMPDLFLQGTSRDEKGLYLYYFKRFSNEETPVFTQPIKIEMPFALEVENTQERGVILQGADGNLMSFWGGGNSINASLLDKKTLKFGNARKIEIKGLPRGFSDYGVVKLSGGRYLFLFSIREAGKFGAAKTEPKPIYNAEGFWSYNVPQVGIYGTLVNDFNQEQLVAKPYTDLNQALFSLDGFALFNSGEQSYIAGGSLSGNIYAYPYSNKEDKFGTKQYFVDQKGIRLRNPVRNASPVYFKGKTGNEGLITVGEGGIYFYKNFSKRTSQGDFIFQEAVAVLQEKSLLYAGSLVVPNLVDWDADGKIDIVTGTSLGYIYFYKNVGSNQQPKYLNAESLKADGNLIHIQAGYKESIQGPNENRWGYTCPTVTDWNGDGLLDILTGDIRGKYVVYLNVGTKTNPKLTSEQPLYHEGLPLYGTWRVKPGVGRLGNRMAYIHQDKDDDFHLYWQADTYNLNDGGKLKIG